MNNLNNKEKLKKLEKVKPLLETYNSLLFFNFSFLENNVIFLLKREIKGFAKWVVLKNTLMRIAVSPLEVELKGQNAVIFCRKEDEHKLLKKLTEFEKKGKFFLPNKGERFYGAIFSKEWINSSKLRLLSNLPGKDKLIGEFCFYLNFGLLKLIKILEKVEKN